MDLFVECVGENETWRRWSVGLGREDWFCSESDEVPDDAMGCKADGTGSQRATEFCRAINHNEVLRHAIHNLAKLVRIC